MKTSISYNILPVLLATSIVVMSACSSMSKGSDAKNLASTGPTIIGVKTNPGTFDLNQGLEPVTRSEIIADVKDFNRQVTDVRIRFVHIPMEIPMRQVSPSTWVADMQPSQLKQLAVNGHTMKYEANVVAKDASGLTAVSAAPVEISVKAPDINSTG